MKMDFEFTENNGKAFYREGNWQPGAEAIKKATEMSNYPEVMIMKQDYQSLESCFSKS